jgi:hypothetical protein
MKKALILFPLLLLAGMPAQANLTGCFAEILSPHLAFPGMDVTFSFYVYNGSPFGEATSEVQFRFPEAFQVRDGWYSDGGLGWHFDKAILGTYDTHIIRFADADGGSGEIGPGTGGTFFVAIHINENADCDEYLLQDIQYGDRGDGLQDLAANDLPFVLCYVPTETSTWSTVKSLY